MCCDTLLNYLLCFYTIYFEHHIERGSVSGAKYNGNRTWCLNSQCILWVPILESLHFDTRFVCCTDSHSQFLSLIRIERRIEDMRSNNSNFEFLLENFYFTSTKKLTTIDHSLDAPMTLPY